MGLGAQPLVHHDEGRGEQEQEPWQQRQCGGLGDHAEERRHKHRADVGACHLHAHNGLRAARPEIGGRGMDHARVDRRAPQANQHKARHGVDDAGDGQQHDHNAREQQHGAKPDHLRVAHAHGQEPAEETPHGDADEETLKTIEETAEGIFYTADCAIGFESARMVLKGIRGFRDEYESHIRTGKCGGSHHQAVPCVSLCPAHVDVPGYVALIHEGRYDDAVNLIRKDNPFPAACGMICEHPCEADCRRSMVDDPINIRGLKRYAVEHEGNIKTPAVAEKTGKKVAVVGGGPGGLSAAYYLSIMGHDVTVYEQRKQLGGMLRYGIPSYRLPREILDREIEGLKQTGFKTVTDTSIGKDISLEELAIQTNKNVTDMYKKMKLD